VLVALAAVGCATSWLASEGQKEREREGFRLAGRALESARVLKRASR